MKPMIMTATKPMNTKASDKKQIFIVDDHAMFREGLRS